MISSRFAICAAAAAVALSLSACSTVDLDKDKAGSITDGTSVEEALSSKTGPLANREVHFDFDSYTVSPDQMPVVTRSVSGCSQEPERSSGRQYRRTRRT